MEMITYSNEQIVSFEGLQAELEAAYKELNCVKDKLKNQEDQIDHNRAKHSDQEDEYNIKISKQIKIVWMALCIRIRIKATKFVAFLTQQWCDTKHFSIIRRSSIG